MSQRQDVREVQFIQPQRGFLLTCDYCSKEAFRTVGSDHAEWFHLEMGRGEKGLPSYDFCSTGCLASGARALYDQAAS